jgi:hypothetical protein
MESRTIDFDAFWAEKERQPIKVKVKGKWYDLPPTLPAGVVVKVCRIKRAQEAGEKVEDAAMVDLAISIIGREQLDSMCEDGLDSEEMGDMVRQLTAVYRGAPLPQAASAGDEEDPNVTTGQME